MTSVYKRYVLVAMMSADLFNFVDRMLIILLLQPIKDDLKLTDTQLGFLTGIAFAIFYATLGVPIARWADRGNRVTIASLAMAIWSLTVMACLLVTNYVQLLFARIAAAVGEAGSKPPTYSLVGTYFPQASQRTRAMAIYSLSGPLAALFSFIVGGRLNELYGWRATFFWMGLPGLALAILIKLTVVEPRTRSPVHTANEREFPSMRTVLATLWLQPSCRHLWMTLILLYTVSYGLGPWYAAFMIRSHGMSTADLGLWLGLIFGITGIVGILLGGYVSATVFAQNERGQMRITAATVAALLPSFAAFLLVPHGAQALAALVPLMVVFHFFLAPAFALLQRLVSEGMRATAMSVVMLLANLIGMGLGPQAVGVASDLLEPTLGRDSLRYAMLAMSAIALWSSYHFWKVGETVERDLIAIVGFAEATARSRRTEESPRGASSAVEING